MTDSAIIRYYARALILHRHGRTVAIRKRGRRMCSIIGADAYDAAILRMVASHRRHNVYPATFALRPYA